MKKIFVPTCRLCDKLNDVMTHCAIFGPVDPENVDSPAFAQGCKKSGDYVRLLHAVPNEHNYIDTKAAEENEDLIVYSSEEGVLTDGMTLDQWAAITFSKRGDFE